MKMRLPRLPAYRPGKRPAMTPFDVRTVLMMTFKAVIARSEKPSGSEGSATWQSRLRFDSRKMRLPRLHAYWRVKRLAMTPFDVRTVLMMTFKAVIARSEKPSGSEGSATWQSRLHFDSMKMRLPRLPAYRPGKRLAMTPIDVRTVLMMTFKAVIARSEKPSGSEGSATWQSRLRFDSRKMRFHGCGPPGVSSASQ